MRHASAPELESAGCSDTALTALILCPNDGSRQGFAPHRSPAARRHGARCRMLQRRRGGAAGRGAAHEAADTGGAPAGRAGSGRRAATRVRIAEAARRLLHGAHGYRMTTMEADRGGGRGGAAHGVHGVRREARDPVGDLRALARGQARPGRSSRPRWPSPEPGRTLRIAAYFLRSLHEHGFDVVQLFDAAAAEDLATRDMLRAKLAGRNEVQDLMIASDRSRARTAAGRRTGDLPRARRAGDLPRAGGGVGVERRAVRGLAGGAAVPPAARGRAAGAHRALAAAPARPAAARPPRSVGAARTVVGQPIGPPPQVFGCATMGDNRRHGGLEEAGHGRTSSYRASRSAPACSSSVCSPGAGPPAPGPRAPHGRDGCARGRRVAGGRRHRCGHAADLASPSTPAAVRTGSGGPAHLGSSRCAPRASRRCRRAR